MELENKMLIDEYWLDYGEEYTDDADDYEWLARIEEEEEGEKSLPYFVFSREQDGYHF